MTQRAPDVRTLERTVYADASPLIGLGRIDRLDLLRLLPTPVHMTEVVWREIAGDVSQPGAQAVFQAREDGLLAIVDGGEPSEYPSLGVGESSTLSAARSVGGAILIDERKARRLIERDEPLATIPYMTIVALIVLGKRRGDVQRVRPVLDALRPETFRISEALYEDVLRSSGEWPE